MAFVLVALFAVSAPSAVSLQFHTSSDAQGASPQKSGKFVIGSVGSNTCPVGSVFILTQSECDAAAAALDLTAKSSTQSSAYQAGCGVWDVTSGGTNVHFNQDLEGNGAFNRISLICKVTPYMVGDAGRNYCPTGTSPILSQSVCDDAALELNLAPRNPTTSAAYQKGCGVWDAPSGGTNVHFNTEIGSGAAYDRISMICTKPTPAPTPAPTPDPTPEPTPDPTPEPTLDPTPEPTPDPTAEPTPCDDSAGTCTVSEDPHVNGFDGGQVSLVAVQAFGRDGSLVEAADKWLVKSSRVSIQARYMENENLPMENLFVRAIAVGGSFLGNGTMVIGSLEDQITWNGKPILKTADSVFEIERGEIFVKAKRGKDSALVQDMAQQNPGVNIELPLGVSLIVNRLHHHINVAIKMPPQEGGQDGVCGNFNGVAADDGLEFSATRMEVNVPPELSLFPTKLP